MEDKLVTVLTATNSGDAYNAKALLESNGIETFLRDENMGSMFDSAAAFGHIKIDVRQTSLEEARDILIEKNYIKIQSPDENLDVDPCPKCSSRKIKTAKSSFIFSLVSLLLFFIPKILQKKSYQCKDCGHSWDSTLQFEHIFWSVILSLFCLMFWSKVLTVMNIL